MRFNINKNIFRWNTLLLSGLVASLLYIITDILAGNFYPGYNFNSQAVSELFAIGAPTAMFVVILFSICSILYLCLSLGIFYYAKNNNLLRFLSFMVFANAINCLILWNFFPMHMRDEGKTFTDTMHTILAINPFILISIVIGSIYFKKWFRVYSIVTLTVLVCMAIISFSFVNPLVNHKPTPGMGLTERIAQYAHQTWHAVLGIYLIRLYKRKEEKQ
jgi:hypothetical protein